MMDKRKLRGWKVRDMRLTEETAEYEMQDITTEESV